MVIHKVTTFTMGVMQRYTLTEQKFVVNYIDLTSEEVYINRVEKLHELSKKDCPNICNY